MFMGKAIIGIAAATMVATAMPTPASAAGNILYILDASGSMWGRFEGAVKIDVAKNVLSERLRSTAAGMNVGLLAYGHRVKDDCTDMELVVPVGGSDPAGIIAQLNQIKPKGKTPIAGALNMSLDALNGRLEENNHVVVISDGLETCDGDPCGAAKTLAQAGINTRVHVVGFDLGPEERAQLECISDNGNGQYFPANSAEELTTAIAQVQTIAQSEPEPAPAPKPKVVEYFRDDFDGEELGEHWEVVNPDPDSYIVEDGFLNVLSATELTLYDKSDELPNLFKLTQPLPKGDWTATLRVNPSITTFREVYALALYTDKDKFLVSSAWSGIDAWNGIINLSAYATKFSKSKYAQFGKVVISGKNFGHRTFPADSKPYTDWVSKHVQAILLRIRKKGRSYFVAAKVEGDPVSADGPPADWVELDKLTSLRSPGKFLVISIGQAKFTDKYGQRNGGETLVNVDWVKIETGE